jgi:glycine cleavage system transcriptional repressor
MSLLGGQFSVMLVLESNEHGARDIEAALEEAARRFDLFVAVRELSASVGEREYDELVAVSVHGADHPGIVARISGEIAAFGANVIDLATHVIGPGTEASYVMSLTVALAAGQQSRDLETRLSDAARDLGVRCVLSSIDTELL